MQRRDTKKPYLSRVNIKVRKETYERLIQTKGAHEMMEKKRLSMDDVVTALLDSVPSVDFVMRPPKRTHLKPQSPEEAL